MTERAKGSTTLFLHIGLPKTASTFLQAKVFPHFEGVLAFDTPTDPRFDDVSDRETGKRVMSCMLKRDPRVWSAFGHDVFEGLLGARSDWKPQTVLISDEGIGRAGTRPDLLAAHLREIRRVAAEWDFSQVAVICALRRQDHWLASHYSQMSDRNPDASQKDFLRAARHLVNPAGDRFKLGMMMDYATFLNSVADAVGQENLFAYAFERQRQDPDGVYQDIAAFVGASWTPADQRAAAEPALANVRSIGRNRWSIRPLAPSLRILPYKVSKLVGLPHQIRRPRPFREKSFILKPEISRIIMDAYDISNQSLRDNFGINLPKYDQSAISLGTERKAPILPFWSKRITDR